MARKKIGHIELQWTCPNCNSLNPGPEKHCLNCGAPQPEDVEFEQASRQELITDEDKIVQAEAGADIHCPYCGSRNPAGTEVCHNCGGDLTEGLVRESGRVVGAYKTGPAAMIACPHCGVENPDTAKICDNCGGSLAQEKSPEPKTVGVAQSTSKSRTWIIIGIVAALVIACVAVIYFITRTDASTGVVDSVNWERSVPVEALLPADYQDWQDEIPADAVVGACSEEVRSIQSDPAPNSVEICGTPYTVDTGGGFAEVVQDCEYEVYDSFCTYTIDEWQVVDVVSASGGDFSPVWPEPLLEEGQRVAEQWEETFTIVFVSDGEVYRYTTTDIDLFQAAQIGSEWTLNINTFGSLVSIEK